MKKWIVLMASLVFFTLNGEADELKVGCVDVKACVEKSKLGLQEKNHFEALKKQMTESLEKSDKELTDLAKKIEDQDYLDSLSPAAEEELKARFQNLSQEFVRYQNQYYQLLNQANYKMLQVLQEAISTASEVVRTKSNFTMILNRDSTFAFAPTLDTTEAVILEMDKNFEIQNSGLTAKLEKK